MKPELMRFGISLPQNLMEQFDAHITKRGYSNRSEAIRDLIRERLIEEEISNDHPAVGILHILYDHHQRTLTEKLTELQHQHFNQVISSTHIHLDHDHCLEAIILKGSARDLQQLADRILATKGVKHGKLYLTSGDGHGL